jgi:hypothetical protein
MKVILQLAKYLYSVTFNKLTKKQGQSKGMQEVLKQAQAAVYKNDDFFCIKTFSGYRSSHVDPKGKHHLLELNASDEALGVALLDALAHSRFLLPEEDPELFDYQLGAERYHAWVAAIRKQYGYKSKRAMFKNMSSCGVEKVSSLITIRPRAHETLEGWGGEGINKEDYVVLPDSSSSAELGAALRLAFSRCR